MQCMALLYAAHWGKPMPWHMCTCILTQLYIQSFCHRKNCKLVKGGTTSKKVTKSNRLHIKFYSQCQVTGTSKPCWPCLFLSCVCVTYYTHCPLQCHTLPLSITIMFLIIICWHCFTTSSHRAITIYILYLEFIVDLNATHCAVRVCTLQIDEHVINRGTLRLQVKITLVPHQVRRQVK